MWNIVGYGGPGIQILRINQIDSEGIQKLILMFVIRCRRYNTVAILRLILILNFAANLLSYFRSSSN